MKRMLIGMVLLMTACAVMWGPMCLWCYYSTGGK